MSKFINQFPRVADLGVVLLDGYVALDSSSDVIGLVPTTTVPASHAYTRFRGASNTLPVHTSTGVYTITLDNGTYSSLLYADAHVSSHLTAKRFSQLGSCNVTGGTGKGIQPGTDPNQTARTLVFRFMDDTGALADPLANTGFFVKIELSTSAR